jgi:MFS family permease
MAACGVCAGYFTCYGTIHIESSLSWRIPFIIQAVLGSVLAMSCLYLPMSPRWLLLNHRREKALEALERLDIPRAEAEKDILRPVASTSPRKAGPRDFLTIFKKEYRGQTMLGLFILGVIQLCGIDGVLYVSLVKLLLDHYLILCSLVRTYSICSSRFTKPHSILPSFWRLSYPDGCSFHPSLPLCGSLGSKSIGDNRRSSFVSLHAYYRMFIRN